MPSYLKPVCLQYNTINKVIWFNRILCETESRCEIANLRKCTLAINSFFSIFFSVATSWCKSWKLIMLDYLIYQNSKFEISRIHSLKYQRSLKTGWTDIWIKNLECMASVHRGRGAMRPWTQQYPVRTQVVSRTLFEPSGILFELRPKTVQKLIF